MEGFKRAWKETVPAAVLSAVICLFGASLFAVFVRAYAPSEVTIAIVNRVILLAAVFLCAALLIHRDRALIKGAVAGIAGLGIATLIFGAIGGFHFTAFFLADFAACALMGGFGGLCGVKIRKE